MIAVILSVSAVFLILGGGYLAACAGAQRWLKFREWW